MHHSWHLQTTSISSYYYEIQIISVDHQHSLALKGPHIGDYENENIAVHNGVWLPCIPGHSRIAGNEIADDLARQAATESFQTRTSAEILHDKCQDELFVREHDKHWYDTKSCHQTTVLMQRVNKWLSRYALTLSRKHLRILISLLTEQNVLNCHLTLMKKKSDFLCPPCEEKLDTSLHFLGWRAATLNRRRNYFGVIFLDQVS